MGVAGVQRESGVRAVYKSYAHLTPVVDVVVEPVIENGVRKVRRGAKLTSFGC